MWERVDVSDWPVQGHEQLGSTENLWLEEPATGKAWLHKDTVIPENGIEQGEDWSEVVSSYVASLLEVPCAPTRLCVRNGRRGSLSASVVPDGHAMYEGAVVMERPGIVGYTPHMEGRPAEDPARPDVKRPGHTLANIGRALRDVHPPTEFAGPEALTAFDVFTGYLLLDALIANRDRHEQNWALLVPQLTSLPERLAPSYDHASSLGFNLFDTKRRALLRETDALERWARKGTAYRFEHVTKAPTLVEHATQALALCTPTGAHWWQAQLTALDLHEVHEALRERAIPGMSDPAAMFASELLDTNLRRVRDVIGTAA